MVLFLMKNLDYQNNNDVFWFRKVANETTTFSHSDFS